MPTPQSKADPIRALTADERRSTQIRIGQSHTRRITGTLRRRNFLTGIFRRFRRFRFGRVPAGVSDAEMGSSDEIRKASNACYRPSAYLLAPGFWILASAFAYSSTASARSADGTPHVACDSHAKGFAEAVQKPAVLRLLSGTLSVAPQDFADQERIIA